MKLCLSVFTNQLQRGRRSGTRRRLVMGHPSSLSPRMTLLNRLMMKNLLLLLLGRHPDVSGTLLTRVMRRESDNITLLLKMLLLLPLRRGNNDVPRLLSHVLLLLMVLLLHWLSCLLDDHSLRLGLVHYLLRLLLLSLIHI